jgi:sarcosine oxidase/L-pipecolate oxidase
VQLPRDRPDLWDRFSPENFPVITLDMSGGAGVYSLPRTEDGVVKVAYRGTKYVAMLMRRLILVVCHILTSIF